MVATNLFHFCVSLGLLSSAAGDCVDSDCFPWVLDANTITAAQCTGDFDLDNSCTATDGFVDWSKFSGCWTKSGAAATGRPSINDNSFPPKLTINSGNQTWCIKVLGSNGWVNAHSVILSGSTTLEFKSGSGLRASAQIEVAQHSTLKLENDQVNLACAVVDTTTYNKHVVQIPASLGYGARDPQMKADSLCAQLKVHGSFISGGRVNLAQVDTMPGSTFQVTSNGNGFVKLLGSFTAQGDVIIDASLAFEPKANGRLTCALRGPDCDNEPTLGDGGGACPTYVTKTADTAAEFDATGNEDGKTSPVMTLMDGSSLTMPKGCISLGVKGITANAGSNITISATEQRAGFVDMKVAIFGNAHFDSMFKMYWVTMEVKDTGSMTFGLPGDNPYGMENTQDDSGVRKYNTGCAQTSLHVFGKLTFSKCVAPCSRAIGYKTTIEGGGSLSVLGDLQIKSSATFGSNQFAELKTVNGQLASVMVEAGATLSFQDDIADQGFPARDPSTYRSQFGDQTVVSGGGNIAVDGLSGSLHIAADAEEFELSGTVTVKNGALNFEAGGGATTVQLNNLVLENGWLINRYTLAVKHFNWTSGYLNGFQPVMNADNTAFIVRTDETCADTECKLNVLDSMTLTEASQKFLGAQRVLVDEAASAEFLGSAASPSTEIQVVHKNARIEIPSNKWGITHPFKINPGADVKWYMRTSWDGNTGLMIAGKAAA